MTADQDYEQADASPGHFVQRYLDSSQNDRRTCRTARPRQGWTAFHRLAEHHGRELCRLLEAIEPSEAVDILGIVNTSDAQRTSVAALLARSIPDLSGGVVGGLLDAVSDVKCR